MNGLDEARSLSRIKSEVNPSGTIRSKYEFNFGIKRCVNYCMSKLVKHYGINYFNQTYHILRVLKVRNY
jgi:hypothetical protein